VAVVSGGSQTGVRGQVLTFDGSGSSDSDGDPLTYAWDFGDGNTGNGAAPGHAYATLGTFTVTLVVSDGIESSAPVSTTVTITNRVPAASVGGPYSGTRGVAVAFDGSASTDADGDPLTFAWDFGDGATGTGPAPSHAYAAFGTYVVTLVVNDGDASSSPAQTQVTVPDRPPVANAGGPYSGVRGQGITFDGSASADPDGNPLTYQWDFGDGTTGTGASPTHVYTTVGSFVARLVVSDGGPQPSAESTATVTIANRPPVANAGGPYAGTRTQAVPLDGSASTDPDGDALTYAWDFGDGAIGTGATPGHLYTTLGTFTVTLTVNDGFTSSPAVTTTLTISNVVPIANAGPDRTVVRRSSVTLDGRGSSDPDGTITYAWRQLSGPVVTLAGASTAQPSFTAPNVTSPTILDFELQVTDNNGATAVDVVRITVIK
jgi:PKD repeat protein